MYKLIKHLLYPNGILFKKLSFHAGTYAREGKNINNMNRINFFFKETVVFKQM